MRVLRVVPALRIVPADAAFGPQIGAWVVAYQQSKRLTVTGIVTSPVWRALSADAAKQAPKRAQGAATKPEPKAGPTPVGTPAGR